MVMKERRKGGRPRRRQGKPRKPLIVATLPPGAKWGPAMSRLSDKERAFVIAMCEVPASRGGRQGGAAMAADLSGFGTVTSSRESLQVIGSRLCSDERIQRAIAEECRRRVKAIGPAAVKAVEALVANEKHRDHFRAVTTVLDRVDPPRTLQHVDVAHTHHIALPPEVVMQKIAAMAERAGVSLKALPAKMIDVMPEKKD